MMIQEDKAITKNKRRTQNLFCYGSIYVIKNRITQKEYVGLTTLTIEVRWKQHSWYGLEKKLNRPLYRSMRKHGIDAFSIEQIERCSTLTELIDKERYWIKKLNTMSPNGYNLTSGGEVFGGARSTKRAQEVCDKLSARLMGHPVSEETKRKISLRKKGKKASNNTKLILSLAQKGNDHRNPRKPVSQFDLDGKFVKSWPSMTAICNTLSLDGISGCCNRKINISGGYIWRYTPDTVTEEDLKKLEKNINRLERVKPVIAYTFDGNEVGRYISINEASQKLNIGKCGIARCCHKRLKTSGGLTFKFVPSVITIKDVKIGDI